MRSSKLLAILLILISISCKAQRRDIIDKVYLYEFRKGKKSMYNNDIIFENDSVVRLGGGRGYYAYWLYPKYKIINDSIYVLKFKHPHTDYTKVKIDSIKRKVLMEDAAIINDTIYWKNDTTFIFRERVFRLWEYKGPSLEDQ